MDIGNDPQKSQALPLTLLKAVIGAFLGSLPALFLYVVLGKIGVVAALCGFFMMMGELIACDKLTSGSDMNFPAALVICSVIMLINIFNGEKLIWCWEMTDALREIGSEVTITDCFANFNELTDILGVQEDFTYSLVQSILYSVLGAVAGCFKLAKKH